MIKYINHFYKRLLFYYAALPTILLLILLLLIAFVFDKNADVKNETFALNRNMSLGRQILDNFSNITRMITKSSHSVIAIKYGDYGGYRRVVLPWISLEKRITGLFLFDNQGKLAISWPETGSVPGDLNALNLKDGEITINNNSVSITHFVYEQDSFLGRIVISSTLQSLGLDKLNATLTFSKECRKLEEGIRIYFCPPSKPQFPYYLTLFLLLTALLGFCSIFYFLSNILSRKLAAPVQTLHNGIHAHESGLVPEWEKLLPNESSNIFLPIGQQVTKTIERVKILQDELVVREQLAKIAAQLAHDIRSPVVALKTAVNSIATPEGENTQLIHMATQRIEDITNDLLKKYRGQNNTKPTPQPLLMKHLLNELILEKKMELKSKLDKQPIALNFNYSEGSEKLLVLAEEHVLKRVISNLINNSVEAFTDKQSSRKIEVKLFQSKGNAVIAIQDNGCGIPKNILENLQNEKPGYRVSTKEHGSGLGFDHAREIIKQLNGAILIESSVHSPSQGTTVTIQLPVVG